MTTRERPILFNAPMVRAILDGRKTQTRRPVKPQPVMQDGWVGGAYWQPKKSPAHGFPERFCIRDIVAMCPLGQPGDRLWVRETCRQAYPITRYSNGIVYRADAPRALGMDEYSSRHKWTPSIHMPRWASRITLEITDVRVQRVQEISEADAIAEGVDPFRLPVHPARESLRHVDGFSIIWGHTYGPDAWARNDFVWAVSFKRVTP